MLNKTTKNPYFRCLTPVGGSASPYAILRAFCVERQLFNINNLKSDKNIKKHLISEIKKHLTFKHQEHNKECPFEVSLFNSATSALFGVFSAFNELSKSSQPLLALGAYTCPEIVSAAIKAGIRVFPVDIDERTLYPTIEQLDVEPDLFLLSNLYGMPDVCDVPNALIIDDACQSFLSKRGNSYVGGADNSTIGITSFGRGKALSGVGGGAVIFPIEESINTNRIKEKVFHNAKKSQDLTTYQKTIRHLSYFGYASAMWALQVPWLYWIPNLCPMLKLGETHVSLDFGHENIHPMQCAAAIAQFINIKKHIDCRVRNARRWSELLSEFSESQFIIEPFLERGFSFDSEVVPLRYPIVCANYEKNGGKLRDTLYEDLKSQGLGASLSYPKAIQEYAEFLNDDRVIKTSYDKTKLVASSILTLPVHEFVSDKDFKKAKKIFRKHLGSLI